VFVLPWGSRWGSGGAVQAGAGPVMGCQLIRRFRLVIEYAICLDLSWSIQGQVNGADELRACQLIEASCGALKPGSLNP